MDGDGSTHASGTLTPANGRSRHSRPVRRFLADLRPGDRADELFLINNVQLATKRNGEPYLKMLLADRSARVATKWWDKGQAMLEKLPDPGVVRAKGRMEDFNGAPQFVLDNVVLVADPAEVDYADLLPSTSRDVGEMFRELTSLLRSMKSPCLRALAEAYLADEPLMASFRQAPAAMTFHHACLGGLLEHTLSAMNVARVVCAFYPQINCELVMFGVFVHDLAKTWELSYATCFDYTDGGRLVGHVVKSAMWIEEKARQAEAATGTPIVRDVVDVLQHIVLAHHGELSLGFGSAKSPATPEAWAVHMIENLDAKLTMALCACRGDDASGRWTDHHKALGGRLFRPDVVREADEALRRPPPAPALASSGPARQDDAHVTPEEADSLEYREVMLGRLFEA